eukprot:TRINITY_DN806_c0_g1_i3.p1 TRINITY_DN806_c0_g1~~TRINITY_DN806_c0_g1_i3.p1  ORF type:complete len:955 (+),score=196.38 TRINITY_DN806_c0_g1_i3:56-2920(+)
MTSPETSPARAPSVRRSGMPMTGGAGVVSSSYVNLLDMAPVKYAMLATWLIVTGICAGWAWRLPGRTTLKWNPPKDSTSSGDRSEFVKHFPQENGMSVFLIAMEWEDLNHAADITQVNVPFDTLNMDNYTYGGITHTEAGTKDFTEALRQRVYQDWCNVSAAETAQMTAVFLSPNCLKGDRGNRITLFSAYWAIAKYDETAASTLKAPMAEYGGRSSIIMINFQNDNLGLDNRDKEFNDYLKDVLGELRPLFFTPINMQVDVFSIQGGIDQILDTVVVDLLLADGIAIPLSLIFAMIVLRNIRLMILPILAILATTLISMAIVAGIAENVMTNVIVTPVMISLVVGLPVGHCLFLLNRFREALLEGEDCKEAVQRMLSTAGTTITLSQLTLALCSFVIALVDVDQVEGLGWAMLICVVVAFLAAVSLVPAVLLCFPDYFEQATQRTAVFGVSERQTVALASRMQKTPQYGTDAHASVAPQLNKDLEDTLWHRYASVTQMKTFQNAIIVAIIIILVIPFGVVLNNGTDTNDSFTIYLPRRDSFTKTAERLFSQYGIGAVSTMKIAAVPKDGAFVLSTTGTENSPWNYLSGELTQSMNRTEGGRTALLTGAWNYNDQPLNEVSQAVCTNWFGGYVLFITGQGPNPGPDPSPLLGGKYNCLWRGAVANTYGSNVLPLVTSLNVSASWLSVSTRVDPLSVKGRDVIENFRATQTEFRNDPNKPDLYMVGMPVYSKDAVQRVSDAWSWMSPVFVLIGFLVILLGTKSVMVGLRAVFTTFLTIVFALGFTSLTYCHGALDWTGLNAISSFDGGVHYLVFVITVPLIIGLSMCHELFLISTAHDWYHYHQLTTKEATKMALIGTGWMNIVSGCILAVSFIGHMFARLPILNQISFAMFWALLFDVLVVKTVLVPTMMAPFGKYNWWPAMARNAPYEISEAVEEEGDEVALQPTDSQTNPVV